MIKILFLSPNLNHYKIKALNNLIKNNDIQLTVIHGIAKKDSKIK